MHEIIEMTLLEWQDEAKRRFGENHMKWKFVCPVCGHVAAVGDFEQYAEQGSTPSSATNECIGRYIPGSSEAFGQTIATKPCNYAGYGLFRLSPVRVHQPDIKDPTHCFAFAEPDLEQPVPELQAEMPVEVAEALKNDGVEI